MNKLVIVGCGWLGKQFIAHVDQLDLLPDWQLFATNRTAATGLPSNVQPLQWLGEHDSPALEASLRHAVWLVALSPGRDRSSYMANLQRIVRMASAWQCQHLLFCSSTGVYSQLAGDVDESSELVRGHARVDALAAAEQVALSFPSCTVLRLAGLIGEGRHPGAFCKSGRMAGGELPVNLVHSEQVAVSIAGLLQRSQKPRVWNLVHPEHPQKANFYRHAAALYGIAEPEFVEADEPARRVHSIYPQAEQWPSLEQYLQNIKTL